MKTYFYEILYNNTDVVYVGVTTRTPTKRFSEHIIAKNLNPKNYSVKVIDVLNHPQIDSLDIYYQEKIKVAELERNYIKLYKNSGCNLFNISPGGEWGAQILNRLLKEKFFETYGSYDGFVEYRKRIDKLKHWIELWVVNKSTNKTKVWISHWISHKSTNKTKVWISSWISLKKKNKTKAWIRHWIEYKSKNKTKRWITSWISHRKKNKTKAWISNWIKNKSTNKTKRWIGSWISYKSKNKTKRWIGSWIRNKRKKD